MEPTISWNTERYRQLRELVERVAGSPPADWRASLERECPTDAALRSEAHRLLERGTVTSDEDFFKITLAPTEDRSAAERKEAASSGWAAPSEVGKYQIVRRFSQIGGQATAYLAVDPDLERHVVLKLYHGWSSGPSGEAEEGRALSKVASPYVARCYGIERIDGAAFLVVEYIPGRNLAELRRDGPVSIDDAVRIVARLAEGVAAVHARGLIHRDIKPANVILHDDGSPRLVDFGLAAHLGSDRLRDLCGSPPYMAPEQARGEWDRIDCRADIFGLGAVLYELLTSRAPYAGTNLNELLERAKKADVTPPRQLVPMVPAGVEAVCLKALAAAPEGRYTTALEFAAALRAAIGSSSVATAPRVPWLRWGLTAALVVSGILVLAAWRSRAWSEITGPPGPRQVAEPGTGPIRATIEVTHYKDLGDGHRVVPLGAISETSLASDPPRLEDLLRIRVVLSRPASLLLIALNPDGATQLCTLSHDRDPGSPSPELVFPERPGEYFRLTDGIGLQAFVVVAADRPLPAFESWKTQVPGGLAWFPVDRDGFWTYDSAAGPDTRRSGAKLGDEIPSRPSAGGEDLARAHPWTEVRGDIVRREAAPEALVSLCDRLRQAPGVSLVRAVAFPVKPKERKTNP